MLRGLFATVAAVSLAAVVFATAAVAGPPTSGTTLNCTLHGNTTVSNFKGNPSHVELTWIWSDGSSTTTSPDIGGKYKPFSTSTPVNAGFYTTVTASFWYRNSTVPAWSGSVACSGP